MGTQLKDSKNIGIDLEHHSDRSFLGFTCLIRLSTNTKHWLGDAIKLRSSTHEALRPFLEDGSIVKVFHDVSNDVR